ncbi:MAG: response regulator, partial [Desulfobacterales bacterium]|nr:response regulator [Desulfobacterales bacterium]
MEEEQRRDTILVVDDTEANIDILLDILEADYEVGVATDGESALEAVAEELPDLILLDIMMPGMDGYQVCERLQSEDKTKDIPVIFVTALEQQENETRGLGLGAVDYITKPFNPEIVKLRVENHLKLVRANQALKRQNEILLENERLRNDVESIARHDMKTPMNTLISIPELLLKEEGMSDNQREMLEMIAQSGFRVMDIINSSIDLYRMEKGEYRLRPVPIDLLKILKQLKGEIVHLMGEKDIPFRILIGG